MSILKRARGDASPAMGPNWLSSPGSPAPLPSGRLRRSTLVLLRWMAVIGQSLAVLIVYFGLGFRFPIWPALLVILASAAFNLVLSAARPLDRRVGEGEALGQLGFDLVQLTALLWLTGGMNNPFAVLLMAPVVTSAATLTRRAFISLALLTLIFSALLMLSPHPLPWRTEAGYALPDLMRFGVLSALLVGMGFISLYAWRVVEEGRRMSQALIATEAVLAHEQKLSALGGLAAAAAHELGTPLATIQLTAKEMQRTTGLNAGLKEDLALVLSQTERCRDILKQLGRRGDSGDIIHDNLTLGALLEEAARPYQNFDIVIKTQMDGEAPEPVIVRRAELIYALRNLIENAVSFAATQVSLSAKWQGGRIGLQIADDGPGFNPHVKDRLGEPFISGPSDERRAGGMGLGVFIAKTLLERTGARVSFSNIPSGGALIEITWPAHTIIQEAA